MTPIIQSASSTATSSASGNSKSSTGTDNQGFSGVLGSAMETASNGTSANSESGVNTGNVTRQTNSSQDGAPSETENTLGSTRDLLSRTSSELLSSLDPHQTSSLTEIQDNVSPGEPTEAAQWLQTFFSSRTANPTGSQQNGLSLSTSNQKEDKDGKDAIPGIDTPQDPSNVLSMLGGVQPPFPADSLKTYQEDLRAQSTLNTDSASSFFEKLQNNFGTSAIGSAISAASSATSEQGTTSAATDVSTPVAFSFGQTIGTHTSSESTSHHIETTLNHPQWSDEFSQKIVWSAHEKIQNAEITISPPELGPISIKLELHGQELSASFASHTHEVRQAIEDAMPKLRNMLESTGISLGDTQVGAQLPQKQQESAYSQQSTPSRFRSETAILAGDTATSAISSATRVSSGRGLVDLFA